MLSSYLMGKVLTKNKYSTTIYKTEEIKQSLKLLSTVQPISEWTQDFKASDWELIFHIYIYIYIRMRW